MNTLAESRWLPIVLLTISNVFMTFAWYGHLKFKNKPLFLMILASWSIAFFEYMLMVPANRWGNSVYSATQLKIIQEIITLSVFVAFAMVYLGEKIRWNHVAAFACILGAVAFTFIGEPRRNDLREGSPAHPDISNHQQPTNPDTNGHKA